MKKGMAVLVTTAHKGVFFGYVDPKDIGKDTLRLTGARCCIYWPASNRGFAGLASMGPQDGAKVGPAVNITLHNITSVSEVTPEGEEKWNSLK